MCDVGFYRVMLMLGVCAKNLQRQDSHSVAEHREKECGKKGGSTAGNGIAMS